MSGSGFDPNDLERARIAINLARYNIHPSSEHSSTVRPFAAFGSTTPALSLAETQILEWCRQKDLVVDLNEVTLGGAGRSSRGSQRDSSPSSSTSSRWHWAPEITTMTPEQLLARCVQNWGCAPGRFSCMPALILVASPNANTSSAARFSPLSLQARQVLDEFLQDDAACVLPPKGRSPSTTNKKSKGKKAGNGEKRNIKEKDRRQRDKEKRLNHSLPPTRIPPIIPPKAADFSLRRWEQQPPRTPRMKFVLNQYEEMMQVAIAQFNNNTTNDVEQTLPLEVDWDQIDQLQTRANQGLLQSLGLYPADLNRKGHAKKDGMPSREERRRKGRK